MKANKEELLKHSMYKGTIDKDLEDIEEGKIKDMREAIEFNQTKTNK